MLRVTLLLSLIVLALGCGENETLTYTTVDTDILDVGFEGYIDVEFEHMPLPEFDYPVAYLNTSLHVYVTNQLNNSFYVYDFDEKPIPNRQLMRTMWIGSLERLKRLRIISMFHSSLKANATMFFERCLSPSQAIESLSVESQHILPCVIGGYLLFILVALAYKQCYQKH